MAPMDYEKSEEALKTASQVVAQPPPKYKPSSASAVTSKFASQQTSSQVFLRQRINCRPPWSRSLLSNLSFFLGIRPWWIRRVLPLTSSYPTALSTRPPRTNDSLQVDCLHIRCWVQRWQPVGQRSLAWSTPNLNSPAASSSVFAVHQRGSSSPTPLARNVGPGCLGACIREYLPIFSIQLSKDRLLDFQASCGSQVIPSPSSRHSSFGSWWLL